jgi:cell division protein ZapA
MNQREPGLVQVRIYDRHYALRTTGDVERLHNLCISLDKRMREIAESSGTVDTLKLAILVALSLADDLDRIREDLKKIDESLSRRSLECVSMLERFLV